MANLPALNALALCDLVAVPQLMALIQIVPSYSVCSGQAFSAYASVSQYLMRPTAFSVNGSAAQATTFFTQGQLPFAQNLVGYSNTEAYTDKKGVVQSAINILLDSKLSRGRRRRPSPWAAMTARMAMTWRRKWEQERKWKNRNRFNQSIHQHSSPATCKASASNCALASASASAPCPDATFTSSSSSFSTSMALASCM